MANVKITDLTELAAVDVASNDVLPIVDINNDSTKKVTIASLVTSVADANDHATFTILNANINQVSSNADAFLTQLNANLDVVQDNVTAVQSRLTTNVTTFTNEDTALQSRLTTNVTAFTNEDTALQTRIAANTLVAASNDFVTFTILNSNINVVSSNVDAVEARRVANVTTFTNEDTALQSRLTTNVTTFTNEDTALQSRLTTNVTAFTNEDTALQARIAANTLVAASNDFITFTRLNANVDVVQDNVAANFNQLDANINVVQDNVATNATDIVAVETRRTNNIAGAISTVLTGDLTVSRALASDSSGKISVATTTLAELNHVNGVTGAIQTQLDAVELRRAANNITTTFTDDVIVTGNLTVNGDTVTINTTNMDVDDTMIMLANGTTGSPANDIGILFNRGDEGNAAFFYDESATTFKLSDTKDPTSNTSLSPVTASNLSVGIVDAATLKYNGLSVDTSIADNASVAAAASAAVETRRVANIAGAISSVLTSDLTADRVMITNGSGKIAASSGVTPTELGFLDGLTLGTVAASKAVTADANGDVNFIREVDIDGNVTIGTNDSNTVTIVGKLDLGAFS
jgi:tellurite resistance protein